MSRNNPHYNSNTPNSYQQSVPSALAHPSSGRSSMHHSNPFYDPHDPSALAAAANATLNRQHSVRQSPSGFVSPGFARTSPQQPPTHPTTISHVSTSTPHHSTQQLSRPTSPSTSSAQLHYYTHQSLPSSPITHSHGSHQSPTAQFPPSSPHGSQVSDTGSIMSAAALEITSPGRDTDPFVQVMTYANDAIDTFLLDFEELGEACDVTGFADYLRKSLKSARHMHENSELRSHRLVIENKRLTSQSEQYYKEMVSLQQAKTQQEEQFFHENNVHSQALQTAHVRIESLQKQIQQQQESIQILNESLAAQQARSNSNNDNNTDGDDQMQQPQGQQQRQQQQQQQQGSNDLQRQGARSNGGRWQVSSSSSLFKKPSTVSPSAQPQNNNNNSSTDSINIDEEYVSALEIKAVMNETRANNLQEDYDNLQHQYSQTEHIVADLRRDCEQYSSQMATKKFQLKTAETTIKSLTLQLEQHKKWYIDTKVQVLQASDEAQKLREKLGVLLEEKRDWQQNRLQPVQEECYYWKKLYEDQHVHFLLAATASSSLIEGKMESLPSDLALLSLSQLTTPELQSQQQSNHNQYAQHSKQLQQQQQQLTKQNKNSKITIGMFFKALHWLRLECKLLRFECDSVMAQQEEHIQKELSWGEERSEYESLIERYKLLYNQLEESSLQQQTDMLQRYQQIDTLLQSIQTEHFDTSARGHHYQERYYNIMAEKQLQEIDIESLLTIIAEKDKHQHTFTATIQQLKIQLDTMKDQHHHDQEQIQQILTKTNMLEYDLQHQNEQSEHSNTTLVTYKEQIERVNRTIDDKNKEIGALHQRIQHLEKDILSAKDSVAKHLQLQTQYDNKVTDMQHLQDLIEQLRTECQSYKDSIQTLEQTIQDEKKQSREFQNQIRRLESDRDQESITQRTIAHQHAAQIAQYEQQEEQLRTTQEKLNDLQKQYREVVDERHRLTFLSQQAYAENDRLRTLHNAGLLRTNNNNNLNTQSKLPHHDEIMSSSSTMQAYTELQTQYEELIGKYSDLEQQNQTVEEQMGKMRQYIVDYRDKAHEKLQTLNTRYKTLKQQSKNQIDFYQQLLDYLRVLLLQTHQNALRQYISPLYEECVQAFNQLDISGHHDISTSQIITD